MRIEDIRNRLIEGLEDNYTDDELRFIDIRLEEISDLERLSLEALDYLCWADSAEMFDVIFDYKIFDLENFSHC